MKLMIDEMKALIARHADRQPAVRLPLRVRQSAVPTLPTHGLYEPMLCFVMQGAKRVIIGERVIEYRAR